MRIVILGSGVIGVTSAYYLAKAGHEVTVIDRQPGPALETSFANAGEISPGYASPWAGPGMVMKAVKWLAMEHTPLIIRPKLDPAQWLWIMNMLRNCTTKRYAVNKSRMVRIAEYSRDCLRELRADIGISYQERSLGTLQLFRTEAQLIDAAKDIPVLDHYNVPYQILDQDGCIEVEPGLAKMREKFVGALRLPDDETGDCKIFTDRLEAQAKALGVRFVYNQDITGIETGGDEITAVETGQERFVADKYVVALGSYSPLLMKKIGISLPIYPVKGYSITVPIIDKALAPLSTIMDETYKIAITRLGDRIRVGGMAELAGYSTKLWAKREKTLKFSLHDLFGGAGDLAQSTFWAGHRPMTPDGTPIIGPTKYKNLHLNTGHGTLGWTMACGSGRVLADMLSGQAPDIDVSDLGIDRYGR